MGSVDEAKAAADAGADAVMIQGVEAGGHVRGTTALSVVLPAVVAAVAPLPVVAAGGVADGRGIAAALMLGAQAVSMGTRFVCSEEASLARAYKERVVRGRAEDTVHTLLFDVGWPDAAHRVLRNAATEEWEAAGRPPSGQRPGEGTIVGHYSVAGQVIEVQKYGVDPPMADFEGDIEQTALYCGQSCSLVNDIRPAAEIVGTWPARRPTCSHRNRVGDTQLNPIPRRPPPASRRRRVRPPVEPPVARPFPGPAGSVGGLSGGPTAVDAEDLAGQ